MGKGAVAAVIVVLLAVVGAAIYVGNNPVSKTAGSLYQKGQNIGASYLNSAQTTLYIQDPPDYTGVTSIKLTFSEVDLLSTNGTWTKLTSSSTSIDLVQVINLPKDMGTFKVPAGTYTQIRFMTSQAVAVVNGQDILLQIPSGSQTGMKVVIPNGLTLSPGGGANLYVDITLDNNGIHNGYLVPTMTASVS